LEEELELSQQNGTPAPQENVKQLCKSTLWARNIILSCGAAFKN
jgi:hypothetical protein